MDTDFALGGLYVKNMGVAEKSSCWKYILWLIFVK